MREENPQIRDIRIWIKRSSCQHALQQPLGDRGVIGRVSHDEVLRSRGERVSLAGRLVFRLHVLQVGATIQAINQSLQPYRPRCQGSGRAAKIADSQRPWDNHIVREVAELVLQDRFETRQAAAGIYRLYVLLVKGGQQPQQASKRLRQRGLFRDTERNPQIPARRIGSSERIAPDSYPAGIEIRSSAQVAEYAADISQPGADQSLTQHEFGGGDRRVLAFTAAGGPGLRLTGPSQVWEADGCATLQKFRDDPGSLPQKAGFAGLAQSENDGPRILLLAGFQNKQRNQDARLTLEDNLLDIESVGSFRVFAGARRAGNRLELDPGQTPISIGVA